jgi:NAD(P)H-hydrate epimerase
MQITHVFSLFWNELMSKFKDRSERLESPEPSRLNLRALSRDELRQLDQSAETIGLSTLALMENAGRGSARVLLWAMGKVGLFDSGKPLPNVLVVCGPGNNGGDGAVLARHLDTSRMAIVNLAWITSVTELRGLAPIQQKILEETTVNQIYLNDVEELAVMIDSAEWIVDGLFGTGLSRAIEGDSLAGTVISQINRSGKPLLALDIPSGLDADTGVALGLCVQATITASFVSTKLGYAKPGADKWTGAVKVIDIGLPRKLLAPFEIE